jgi:predicted NBD/HSP70 family sugar kinase
MPEFFGLELVFEPLVSRCVVIDDAGTVRRRTELRGAPHAEAPDPAFEAFVGDALAAAIAVEFESPLDYLGTDSPALGRLQPSIVRPGAAAVTAEAWIGAARGARHAVCLHIGERVLAGILLEGHPWAGAHQRAGTAAWLAINPVERQDYRAFGSLAAEVSDAGIARRLAWRIQAGDASDALEAAGEIDAITAAHVFDAARRDDGVAVSVARDTARYVGMAAANLALAVDPEVVVIGGRLAGAADVLADAVRQEYARRMPPGLAGQVRLEFSQLGEEAIAIGAARLAMQARA